MLFVATLSNNPGISAGTSESEIRGHTVLNPCQGGLLMQILGAGGTCRPPSSLILGGLAESPVIVLSRV